MSGPKALVFDTEQNGWLSFGAPTRVHSTHSLTDVIPTLQEAQTAARAAGTWLIGWLTYEAAPAFDSALEVGSASVLPLLWFGEYREPTFLDELPAPPVQAPGGYVSSSWRPLMSKDVYAEAFAAVHSKIQRGDTYQVNLSFRLQSRGLHEAYALFYSMVSQQAGRYSIFVDSGRFAVCSASPELFFARDGRVISCRPMKGTARRQPTAMQDDIQREMLATSAKDRAENVMIVDMVRNDLSRIACDGSVEASSLFEVERFPGVFQMVSDVRATTDASLTEILSALFPSASITGAPKPRTMQIISQTENSPRGLYTGSLGVISPHDRQWFNVAIRTAVVDRQTGTAEYGVGSGVVWDSTCEREYEECLLKAGVVQPAAGIPGVFETLLWEEDKGYWLLDYHIERMLGSAKQLGYPCDEAQVREKLARAVGAEPPGSERLRVRLMLNALGSLAIQVSECTPVSQPYRVALAREPICSSDFRLHHKTTDRSIYDTAVPSVSGVEDVLLWNERGDVTESRIANVVVSLGGILYTPPLSSGLLPGCFRRHLLAQGTVIERVITIAELREAEEIYLANSLRGLWRVEPIFEALDQLSGTEGPLAASY
jgi:para-aminobenzoate synthetase/4-amino-4-deoxychorismate lyase